MSDKLLFKLHKNYLKRCLGCLPTDVQSLEPSRPTLLFFVLAACDNLDILHELINDADQKRIIEWIYSRQIQPITDSNGNYQNVGGFRGTTIATNSSESLESLNDSANLAMTYSSLVSLVILGDDLSRVHRHHILSTINRCQCDDGSFFVSCCGGENDMRFVFCASAILRILQARAHEHKVNADAIVRFIRRSQSYDGGIAQLPGLESHGGSTYCAIAALSLLNRLEPEKMYLTLSRQELESIINWCCHRQNLGLHGRIGKQDDSCYSFWIGATLSMLGAGALIDRQELRSFILTCQDQIIGGFARSDADRPDLMHTYLSLAGLSLGGEPHLLQIYAPLNLTKRAQQHLKRLYLESKDVAGTTVEFSNCSLV